VPQGVPAGIVGGQSHYPLINIEPAVVQLAILVAQLKHIR